MKVSMPNLSVKCKLIKLVTKNNLFVKLDKKINKVELKQYGGN